jgi:hypothetical protein
LFFKYINSEEGNKLFAHWLTSAGGTWTGKAIEGIITYVDAPKFIDVATSILEGNGTGIAPAVTAQTNKPTPPAQSGQQPAAPVIGTTPGGATVSGDWK